MDHQERLVEDVIGQDKALLDYWDKMPDKVKQQLLASDVSVSTLGELQLMANQLRADIPQPPKVF